MVRVKTSAIMILGTKEFCDKIQNCVNLLSNNSSFPSPSPELPVIQSAITSLKTLETQSQNGSRIIIAEKRTARSILSALFQELTIYLAFQVRNAPDAEELINSIGLETAKPGRQHYVGALESPQRLRAGVSREPGAIELRWSAVKRGVYSYIIEMRELSDNDTESTWQQFAATKVTYTKKGLKRGSFYVFRVRGVGAGSVCTAPSATVTCVAG